MENEKNTSNFKIVPSVKEVKYLKKAIQSDNLCIQLTGVHIGNLQQLSHICHQAGKTVIVNHELVKTGLLFKCSKSFIMWMELLDRVLRNYI